MHRETKNLIWCARSESGQVTLTSAFDAGAKYGSTPTFRFGLDGLPRITKTNNRLRKYLPSSTEPTALTNRYLRSISRHLNSMPRKCFGYRTPAEVFESKLMEVQNRLE